MRFDGREVPVLSVEDELMLISIHAAKHFWTRLMWVADVAALISQQNVEWDRAISVAREVSAERMLRIALLLAVNVLGARVPVEVKSFLRSDSAAIRIAARIARRLHLGESARFRNIGARRFSHEDARRSAASARVSAASFAFAYRRRLGCGSGREALVDRGCGRASVSPGAEVRARRATGLRIMSTELEGTAAMIVPIVAGALALRSFCYPRRVASG